MEQRFTLFGGNSYVWYRAKKQVAHPTNTKNIYQFIHYHLHLHRLAHRLNIATRPLGRAPPIYISFGMRGTQGTLTRNRDASRVSTSMDRKRDRPTISAFAAHDTTSSCLSASAGGITWDYDDSISSNIASKPLHYPSPNNKLGNLVTAGAATVSPFCNRMPGASASDNPLITSPPLSPVPEESHSNFDLSQASNTSTLTFDCNNAASDSNCSMEISGEGSIGAMTSGGNAMDGTVVRSVMDSVVDFSVGLRRSSISPGSHLLHDIKVGMPSPENDECTYPPTKRSRLDYGPHILSQSSHDYAMSSSSDALMSSAACKTSNELLGTKKIGVHSTNSKMNFDKYDVCCHVCFMGSTSGKNSSFASTSNVQGSSVPDRHSLFAYFQPTKRKTHPISQHHHQQPTNTHHTLQTSFPSLNLQSCRYCDKPTCYTCTRQCEQCQNRFCSFCTKVDYEMSIVERILCFECDEHHGRNALGSRFVRRQNVKESCCMMDI